MISAQMAYPGVSWEEDEDLARVLDEVTAAMAGRGAVLSRHPGDGQSAHLIECSGGATPWRQLIEPMVTTGTLWPGPDRGETPMWIDHAVDDRFPVAFSVPVKKIYNYSRLVITVFFGALSREAREHAEQTYLRRRPFAVGYFRLWQLARHRHQQMLALETALNLNEMGVILLDRSSRVVFTNAAADAILTQAEGLCRRDRRIGARELQDTIKLNAAIEHIIAAEPEAARQAPLFRVRRKSGPPLVIAVLPNEHRATEPDDVAAILFIIDPGRSLETLLQPICKLYRLSPIETRLACLLVTGATVQESAGVLRIKEQTARSYLKQIFLKTETNRQAELIRTMLTGLVRTNSKIQAEVL